MINIPQDKVGYSEILQYFNKNEESFTTKH